MRKRIEYFTINTTSFQERVAFSKDTPHSLRYKYFPFDEVVPLHYSDTTMEILIAKDILGEVTIDNTVHVLEPRDVLFIPPYTIHGTHFRKCPGKLINIKISFEDLKAFVDLDAIVGYTNQQMRVSCAAPELYEDMARIAQRLVDEDDNIFSRMHCMLEIAENIARIQKKQAATMPRRIEQSDMLHDVLQWTYDHYQEHIMLDTVSQYANMSKYHFCVRFKALTGMTYVTFLNQVRIDKSCYLLKSGCNVSECVWKCGFENMSYFIQVFKKCVGCTPLQYVKAFKRSL